MKEETNSTLSIKNLRRRGWKVRVMHSRHYFLKDRLNGASTEVSPKGGITVIEITSPDKQINTSGKAVCSDEDNYDRKVGNSIALGRAYKNALEKMETSE
jgi:hypothetical protein